jgi:ribonuclease P protein component
VRAGAFIALVLPNGGLLARLGMIIARRHTRTAVRRNRIKRLIREGFRQRQAQFLGLDIVVMLRSRAEADSTRHLAQLWQELQTCCAPGLSP